MRKVLLLLLPVAFSILVSTASAQLKLVPLNTFGPNGDGTLRPGDVPYLTDTNSFQRGMAFNPATCHLIIVNRSPLGAETINVIDALTGADMGQLDQSGRATGGSSSFVYNVISITPDGAIYVGNLTTSGTVVQFNLYRWADENSPQMLVYFGNPGNTMAGGSRWGDTLAARGTGMNTEVLLATQNGTLAAILRPSVSDLTTFNGFTNAPLNAAVPSGGVGGCLAFGTGSTFYGKGNGSSLYFMDYDTGAGTATPVQSYNVSQFPTSVGPLMVLSSSNWLAGIQIRGGTNQDNLRLYDISNPANPPVLLDRVGVSNWTNDNTLNVGAVAFGFGTNIYALDNNDGIAAFSITNGTDGLAPVVFSQPASPPPVQLTSNVVFAVGADGTAPLSYQWYFNGASIAGATTNSYAIASAQFANIGSYSVIVTNTFGSRTSSVVTLFVLQNTGGNVLVYDPFPYAVGSVLDGQGGWALNPGSGSFTNIAGSLTVPYLQASQGNQVLASVNGTTRKPIGTYTNGTLYYSFAFKLDKITSTASETVAAFAIGTSTTYSPKINIMNSDASLASYTIGIYKGGGATSANGAIATNSLGNPLTFTTSDTVFIIGRYVFNAGTNNNDTCDLWINPDPSTFGVNPPPPPTVGPIGSGVTDISQVDRFVLRYASGYTGRHFDEVRVGFDWASVTPPSPPSLAIALAGSNALLSWPTNISSGYGLQSINTWDDPDGWQPVTSPPIVVQGPNNTVTVPPGGTSKFYRLRK